MSIIFENLEIYSLKFLWFLFLRFLNLGIHRISDICATKQSISYS